MKHHCSSSFDRLSELPSNVIETILMFLPLRDMVRTSVLSSNWRFQWVTVPQLVFEHDLLDEYDKEDGIDTSICNKDIVFGTLLLHHGPIFKFKLDMSCWRSCSEINIIIPLLSRYGIQDLTFVTGGVIIPAADESDEDEEECVKLPSSIFSCVQLKHLSLTRCVFQPLTLVGFNKLISIELIDVGLGRNVYIPCGPLLESLKLETASYIDFFGVEAPNLKSLCFRGRLSSVGCMKTPNLKALSLYVTELNLFKLLRALPLLENLILCGTFPMKSLLVGDSPNELPTVLNNLNMLHFSLAHTRDMDQLSSTLLWIRSQPNLRILKLMDIIPRNWMKFELNSQMLHHCDYSLMKVREMNVEVLFDMSLSVEFIKFLLVKLPELETLYIKPPNNRSDLNMYKILLELACSRRASPKAEIVFLGLDSNRT